MLILAIDSAHKNGSVTLAKGDDKDFQVIQTLSVEGGAFSAQIVPRISQILSNNNFKKSDVDGFAVCVGPGSFTGLRIGLSAIKGLADVLKKPIAPVSSLEAIAASASADHNRHILSLLDALRSEVYFGEYLRSGGSLIRQKEALCTHTELGELLHEDSSWQVVTTDQKLADVVTGFGFKAELVPEIGSQMIARLGLKKLLAGDTITADDLDANYVRRDDSLFNR